MLRINWITVSIFWHQWNMYKTILYRRSKYVMQYSFTSRNAINQKTLLFHYLQFNFFKVYDTCIFVRRIIILWIFLTMTVLNFCAEQTSVPNDYDRCTLFHWHGKWLERRIYDDDTWSTAFPFDEFAPTARSISIVFRYENKRVSRGRKLACSY